MKKLLVLTLFLSVFSCTPSDRPLAHKRNDIDIPYYLNIEANQLTQDSVIWSFDNWSSNSHFIFDYKGRNKAGIKKDGKNTISFIQHWPQHIPLTKVAWCHNWYDRKGIIVESDIIFNMDITSWTTIKTMKDHSYIIEGVLTHEIGHMIGLGHSSNSNCLMKSISPYQESYFKGKIDTITLSMYSNLYFPKP